MSEVIAKYVGCYAILNDDGTIDDGDIYEGYGPTYSSIDEAENYLSIFCGEDPKERTIVECEMIINKVLPCRPSKGISAGEPTKPRHGENMK